MGIPVDLTAKNAREPNAPTFQKLFEAEYTNLFGRPVESMAVEITVWSVNAYTPTPKVQKLKAVKTKSDTCATATRKLFDAGLGVSVDAKEYRREDMSVGSTAAGPAVVTENETTVVVPTSRAIIACADGTLDVYARKDRAKEAANG